MLNIRARSVEIQDVTSKRVVIVVVVMLLTPSSPGRMHRFISSTLPRDSLVMFEIKEYFVRI